MKMNWMKHWTKPKDSLGEPPIPLDRGAVRIKRAYMTMAASLALAMLFVNSIVVVFWSYPLTWSLSAVTLFLYYKRGSWLKHSGVQG